MQGIIADGFPDKESCLSIINDMEEFRIDCLHQTEEELGVAKRVTAKYLPAESYDAGYGGIS